MLPGVGESILAAGALSRKMRILSPSSCRKQRVKWKWGEAINSQSTSSMADFLNNAVPPKCATNRGQSAQMHNPMEDISHLEHHDL